MSQSQKHKMFNWEQNKREESAKLCWVLDALSALYLICCSEHPL